MLVGASVAPGMTVAERRAFALERLKQTATYSEFLPGTTAEVEMDSLPGIEITAGAVHSASHTRVMIYQVMLFEEAEYYLMQAIASEKDKDQYLPVFKKVAGSFKRRGPQERRAGE